LLKILPYFVVSEVERTGALPGQSLHIFSLRTLVSPQRHRGRLPQRPLRLSHRPVIFLVQGRSRNLVQGWKQMHPRLATSSRGKDWPRMLMNTSKAPGVDLTELELGPWQCYVSAREGGVVCVVVWAEFAVTGRETAFSANVASCISLRVLVLSSVLRQRRGKRGCVPRYKCRSFHPA
jgi:hypothetical protein